jgi:hypothetical protein
MRLGRGRSVSRENLQALNPLALSGGTLGRRGRWRTVIFFAAVWAHNFGVLFLHLMEEGREILSAAIAQALDGLVLRVFHPGRHLGILSECRL